MLTRPLELGADLVMHAATKYLNGHSDLIAGVLVTTADDDFWKRVKTVRAQIGGTLGSFESWLLLRGMRTLYLRVRTAQRIGAAHRRTLRAAPPCRGRALPGPAAMHRATRSRHGRCKAASAACCRSRAKGGEAAAIATAAHVQLWKRATSLGGTESLIEHRASVEGAGTPAPPDLLRLSVGIEARRRPDRRPRAGAATGASLTSPSTLCRRLRWR